MSTVELNEHGVPQFPKGHTGRLLVTLAAIDKLDSPTSSSVAVQTGLSKGNIGTYVMALNNELRTHIVKNGPEYVIESWGDLLNPESVRHNFSGFNNPL